MSVDPRAIGLAVGRSRSLGILYFGDSHWNGNAQEAVAVGDTAGNIGTLALTSPLDKMWTGTADASYFQADCQINSTSTPSASQDQSNSAVGTQRGGPILDMLACLRRGYPRLGRIRIANLAVGGSSAYSWAGERAAAFCGALGTPLDGDTITLGSVTYTFRTAASAANEVTINGANGSMQNLMLAVNAESGTSGFGAATTANPSIVALNPASTQYGRFYAKSVGTAGNSLTLTGGVAARVTPVTAGLAATASQALSGGSATSAIYANGKALVPAGFGTVNAVAVSLGTNDAARSGIRGSDTQTNYQTLINNIKADFPTAKIIVTRPPNSRNGTTQTALTNTVIPAIDAVIAANPGVVSSADLWSLGLGGGHVAIVESAGTHLTQYGYSIMSQLFATTTAAALNLT